MKRIDRHDYYLEIAKTVSKRSTCERLYTGSVIVKDDIIIGTGYNGSLPGKPHCKEDNKSCMFNGHCIRTTHCEVNAIVRATKISNNLEDAVMYSTHSPCYACIKTVAAFGIKKIYYSNLYQDDATFAYAELVGIELIKI
jgi:dCMP deaminase